MRLFMILLFLSHAFIALADDLYESPIIGYETKDPNNKIADLQKAIDAGDVTLDFDSTNGYLTSVLQQLDVPAESQTLVFSKTSFHRKLINTQNPRALYFNDNVYVGWTPGAELLEIGVVDHDLGALFYTLKQRKKKTPLIQRNDSCLSCHVSGRTSYEPGFMIRSIFPDAEGEPIAKAGSDTIDHTSPIESRWGGWFVTSEETSLHRGNRTYRESQSFDLQPSSVKSLADLKSCFNPKRYLADTSDIGALIVLEHQVRMHNYFTQSHFQTIKALESEAAINKALGESGRRPFTQKLINNAAEHILEYLLFVDEAPLHNITANQSFLDKFTKDKAVAANGDSLYNLKFDKGISELPCSWLIYSDSFTGLHPVLKEVLLKRLKNILTAKDLEEQYIHLRKTRKRIHQVLVETLPAYQATL